jgi:hypothetical protein
MKPRLYLAPFLSLVGLPLCAQTEDVLRQALEGKYVSVDLDLPAAQQGLDLRFDREEPLNLQENYKRIRDYDVAIPRGRRAQVSRVKVKGDHIEFQLEGGGFNWITDTTTRSFSPTSKSSREKDLDDRIKSESDSNRKRDMESERDDLRRERERRDSREQRDVDEYNLEAHRRDQDRAVRSGSRINLRFKKRIPPEALTPDGLMQSLSPWVQFDDDRRDRRRR